MSINIQELINFNVNGLNELLTETQKQKLAKDQKELKELKSEIDDLNSEIALIQNNCPTKTFTNVNGKCFTRKLLAVDVDYSIKQKAIIFLHGKSNYKLWFLNKANKLCLVSDSKIVKDNLYLDIIIDTKYSKSNTAMSLDRFLYLIEIGDFKIINKKFIEYYLKPYVESNHVKRMLAHLLSQKQKAEDAISNILESEFYKDIESLYNKKRNAIVADYKDSTKGLIRDIEAEKAKNKRVKQQKAQTIVKNLWDSVVPDSEKAYFIGWICGHVDNIFIKVVKDGVSDKVISASYPDNIYGNKYREKANSSGWDASSGKIRFTDIETAPLRTFEALATAKHINRSISGEKVVFKGKTLSNLDLCLFILGSYHKYGFKSGVNKLYDHIDYEDLCADFFPNYIKEFMKGFEA